MTEENLDLELDENSKAVVKYIQKYLEKNDNCYDMLCEIINHPKLEQDFSDEQWTMIIEQALTMAYKKAMADNFISPEERIELNKIYNLGYMYKNSISNRFALNFRVLNTFKNLARLDKEELNEKYDRRVLPKPSPFPKPWEEKR